MHLHGRLDVSVVEDSEEPTRMVLTVVTADGSVALVVPSNLHAAPFEPQLAACKGRPDVDVVALQQLEVLLRVACP